VLGILRYVQNTQYECTRTYVGNKGRVTNAAFMFREAYQTQLLTKTLYR